MSEVALYDWQLPSCQAMQNALKKYGVAANASEMGTGKTYVICELARRLGKPLVVICPKSVVPEWQRVSALFEVPCEAVNYEKVRTGKTPHGDWQVPGRVWEWTTPVEALLVFDEAHRCGATLERKRVKGAWTQVTSQTAALLIAARRQNIPLVLASGTLFDSPIKAYALGYALGLHSLVNYFAWARQHGVTDGYYGPEWKPKNGLEIMEKIRHDLGDRFTRVRKADVPGFPLCQNIPIYLETEDMPELESEYGIEARAAVELLKVEGIVQKTTELIEDEGMSVAIFVNFRATLTALQERFPDAPVICGGQTPAERAASINSFQQNEPPYVILVMAQAGGTGTSLHDLHGRPRAAIVSPGHNPVEFQQVLGRIHRAGALSPAINFIAFASGVPVERRIRANLEHKQNNLSALNDADLYSPYAQANHAAVLPAHAGGTAPQTQRVIDPAVAPHPDQCPASGDHRHQPPPTPNGPTLDSRPRPRPSQEPTRSGGGLAVSSTATVINTPAATEQATHSERKHARSSPSKLKNLRICPSYRGDEDGPVHPVTLRGTAMHEAMETGNDAALDADEKNLVQMCRDFLADELAWAERDIQEEHLKTHDPDVQGFVDRLLIGPKKANNFRTAKIRDYKMGFNLVDSPEQNDQAIAYTVATFLGYPDVDEVDFAFLIPRQDTILQHTFPREELAALMLRISTIADRVRKLDGVEFNVDFDNCLYCGRKATCGAVLSKVLAVGHGMPKEDKLPLPAVITPDQITEPQQLAYGLNLAAIAESWAEKMKAFALRVRLELGVEIPGYDLIERSAKREITNPVAAFDVAKEFGVTEQEYLAAASVKITSLETSVKAHAADGDKEKAAKRMTDRLMDVGALSRGASFHVLQRSRKKAAPKQVLPAA